MTGDLVRYDTMCRAIAEAYEVDEVKDIRDKAMAFEHYARLSQNTEAERQCREIRIRAERKAGEILAAGEKAKGSAQPGIGRAGGMRSDGPTTLRDLGISKQQSSDWQRLAAVPDAEFETALASVKPTTSGIINAAAPVDDEVLLEQNKRETLVRLTEAAYRGTLAWSSNEFVEQVRSRIDDPEFRRQMAQRVRVDGDLGSVGRGAAALIELLGEIVG